MLKFLLTILLISAGIRIVTGNGAWMFKPDFEKTCFQDKEDGKGKGEKKQTEKPADDTFPLAFAVHFEAINVEEIAPVLLRHHQLYYSFFNSPNTPPPDWA
ncbi:hypothetical protein [Segetibacter sp.]|jgi:hypothetical protein|uniref:hypothetical protein n=1 Tax=Segetibacter sp. TaxID=2231182 RepID=UPI002634D375|nr:hypothetical protein [Segetibacter sp.]MCW3079418.1 hypothetical protein [Segetibacter sp.]